MVDGARGIIARDLISGKLERHFGHAVLSQYRWLRKRILLINQRNGIGT